MPDMLQNENLPSEIGEVIQIIFSKWSEEEKQVFSMIEMTELNSLKLTLGLDIRNIFQLWSGNQKLLLACKQEIEKRPELKEILWKIFYLSSWEEGLLDEEKQGERAKEEEKSAFAEVFSEMNAYLSSELIIYLTWNSLQKNQSNLVQLS
ncbi:MAG: hypothetical protein PHD83_04005 [Caldisericia bacterium]|nr:hypothetical protein [Caldisericia bacterium]